MTPPGWPLRLLPPLHPAGISQGGAGRRVYLTGRVARRRYSLWESVPSVSHTMEVRLGIVVNSSCDTTRPLLRLLGLIASVVAFAVLWSGDQKIQQEIAATRARTRPVYAGPSVMQNLPLTPRSVTHPVARSVSSAVLGFLDRIPGGYYQLTDAQGNRGTLVLESRLGAVPVSRMLTIQSSHGELRLTPMQTVSASSLIDR